MNVINIFNERFLGLPMNASEIPVLARLLFTGSHCCSVTTLTLLVHSGEEATIVKTTSHFVSLKNDCIVLKDEVHSKRKVFEVRLLTKKNE